MAVGDLATVKFAGCNNSAEAAVCTFSQCKDIIFLRYGESLFVEMRLSWDHLIFITETPVLIRLHLCIDMALWWIIASDGLVTCWLIVPGYQQQWYWPSFSIYFDKLLNSLNLLSIPLLYCYIISDKFINDYHNIIRLKSVFHFNEIKIYCLYFHSPIGPLKCNVC